MRETARRERVRCEPRRRAEANQPMTGRKRIDGIKTGVESLPRDESGGDLLTAQAVPGLKVARARFRLWCGTCEPALRHGPVGWGRRERDPQAAETARGRVATRGAGADRLVVAVKPRNGGGAKGAGRPGSSGGQP